MLFKSLIKKILDKLLPSKLAIAEKTEITEMLVDMQKRVAQGTSKIDEQIPVLQKILKDIDRIEECAPQSTLDTKLIDLSKRTGASPEEARKALIDAANEAYPPGSSKTMKIDDDATLEAYIDTREQMGMKLDLLEDIVDRVDPSPEVRKQIEEIAKQSKIPDMDALEFTKFEAGLDDALKANQQKQADLKAVEDLMADPKNIGKGIGELMQEVQDAKVIPFMKYKPNPKPKKKATGGRVQLKDGGGPKITRRSVLQMMGAGIGSLMMPRGAKKVADAMAPTIKKIVPAPGMPDWFPLLAQQIKTKGKKVREPDYADFTSGGDTTVRYELKDKNLAGDKIFLEEDMQTGTVSIFGRGDDYQQVSMDYFPGSRTVDKSGRIRESEPDFEMMEFAKGEIQDIENFGGIDEMRGDLGSWIKLSGIDKTAKKQLEEVKKLFKEETKDPNVDVDEFAKGGGVGSLFKRKA